MARNEHVRILAWCFLRHSLDGESALALAVHLPSDPLAG